MPFPPPDPPRPSGGASSTDPVGMTIDAIDSLVAARVRHDTAAAELRPAIRITVERARTNVELALRALFHAGGPRRSSSTRMAAVRPGEALLVSGLPAGGASLHETRVPLQGPHGPIYPSQPRVDARAEPADPDGSDPTTTGTPFPLHDDEDE